MKKIILIFAIALLSCTREEVKTECDCNTITLINDVPNGETYPYNIDKCSEDGKLLFLYYEPEFITKRIVKCK